MYENIPTKKQLTKHIAIFVRIGHSQLRLGQQYTRAVVLGRLARLGGQLEPARRVKQQGKEQRAKNGHLGVGACADALGAKRVADADKAVHADQHGHVDAARLRHHGHRVDKVLELVDQREQCERAELFSQWGQWEH